MFANEDYSSELKSIHLLGNIYKLMRLDPKVPHGRVSKT
jgi:hypothetical protein